MVTLFAPTFCGLCTSGRVATATAKEPGAAWPFEAKPQRDFSRLPGGRSLLEVGAGEGPTRREALRATVPLDRWRWCRCWSLRPSPQPSRQAHAGPPLPHRRRARSSRRPGDGIAAANSGGDRCGHSGRKTHRHRGVAGGLPRSVPVTVLAVVLPNEAMVPPLGRRGRALSPPAPLLRRHRRPERHRASTA